MTHQDQSLFHSILQKIASSAPMAWLLSHTIHHMDPFLLRHSGGRLSFIGSLGGVPIVILTTTGAKSGLPRSLPLIAIRDPSEPEKIAFIASNWGQGPNPAWYYNLKANPNAKCSIKGGEFEFEAHEASGAEYDKYWEIASAIYSGYPKYQQRNSQRHIPIMVLVPADALQTTSEV